MVKEMTNRYGDVYEGTFKDGKLSLEKMTNRYGDVYEGTFKGGKLHGQGKLIERIHEVFEGTFKDGNLNGKVKKWYIKATFMREHLKVGS